MKQTMYFSRSSTYQTTEEGDSVDFTPDNYLSFPANTQCISFTAYFDSGTLRSNTTSGKSVDVNLQVYCNNDWRTLTCTTIYVPGYNSSSTVTINEEVPSDLKKMICQYGVTDIRLEQASSSRFRGYAGSGTLEISYESTVSLSSPGTPTIGTDGNGNYTVSWTAASASGGSGSVSYVVHYGPEDDTVSAGTATSKTIAIPASYYNTAISFFIEASYSGLTTTSNSRSYTATRAALSAPSNVKLNSTTSYGSNVTLSWTAPANASNNHLTGFYVDRREYNGSSWGSWGTLKTGLSASTTSLSVAVPSTVNHQYQFRVTATGQASNSGATVSSNTVTTIYGAISAPTNVALSATTSYGEQVVLSWTSPGDGANNALTGFAIERREYDGSDYGEWTSLSTVAKTVTSLSVDVPATANHKYQFRVKALGTYSNSSTTDSSNLVTRLIQGKCSVPSTFKATEIRSNNKYFYLMWEGALGGENNRITGYEIQTCTSLNNGLTYDSWASLGVFTPTVSFLHLVAPTARWTRYKYRIQVRGSAGVSYYSDWKELPEAVMRPSPEIQEELFANGTTHVKINGQWTTDTAHLYTTQWDTI